MIKNDLYIKLKGIHLLLELHLQEWISYLSGELLKLGMLSAQIDYIVVTKKICFVIECKNLYGDIEINSTGDFIRTIEFGGRKKREGIYSTITQNQIHLELIKKIKIDNRKNILTKYIAGRYFEDFNKSIVVLANPKTVLNVKYAKKEVKEKVIRADQLVKYIKEMHENSKVAASSENEMLSWAQSYLAVHKDIDRGKYEKYKISTITPQKSDEEVSTPVAGESTITVEEVTVEETDIFKELKAYRLHKSREEKIKPYLIYNDNQLKDLISRCP